MSLKAVAEEYFSSISTIASRLCTDLKETRTAYDKLWWNLSLEEQNQILNESVIKPEACLHYSSLSNNNTRKEEFAAKRIVDDNCSYRDEHSAPFSFRTPSQRDLTIFEDNYVNNMKKEIINAPKINTESKKNDLINSNENTWIESSSEGSYSSLVPKTGLDFLDNW